MKFKSLSQGLGLFGIWFFSVWDLGDLWGFYLGLWGFLGTFWDFHGVLGIFTFSLCTGCCLLLLLLLGCGILGLEPPGIPRRGAQGGILGIPGRLWGMWNRTWNFGNFQRLRIIPGSLLGQGGAGTGTAGAAKKTQSGKFLGKKMDIWDLGRGSGGLGRVSGIGEEFLGFGQEVLGVFRIWEGFLGFWQFLRFGQVFGDFLGFGQGFWDLGGCFWGFGKSFWRVFEGLGRAFGICTGILGFVQEFWDSLGFGQVFGDFLGRSQLTGGRGAVGRVWSWRISSRSPSAAAAGKSPAPLPARSAWKKSRKKFHSKAWNLLILRDFPQIQGSGGIP